MQSTETTRSGIFKTHHYGLDHYWSALFKIFVFMPHRTVKLHQSSSQPVLLHFCTGLATAASFSCCGERVLGILQDVVGLPGWSCSAYTLVILQKRHKWEPEVKAWTINRSLYYVLINRWTPLTLNGAWRHSTPQHHLFGKVTCRNCPLESRNCKTCTGDFHLPAWIFMLWA